jgi:hypothetical protein
MSTRDSGITKNTGRPPGIPPIKEYSPAFNPPPCETTSSTERREPPKEEAPWLNCPREKAGAELATAAPEGEGESNTPSSFKPSKARLRAQRERRLVDLERHGRMKNQRMAVKGECYLWNRVLPMVNLEVIRIQVVTTAQHRTSKK